MPDPQPITLSRSPSSPYTRKIRAQRRAMFSPRQIDRLHVMGSNPVTGLVI